MQPHRAAPFPEDLARAADLLAEAEAPVIFAQRGAGSERAFGALAEMAEDWGIPVCQYWAMRLAVPTDHPMDAGPDPAPLLEKADVVLVIDALAPWSPDVAEPREDATVIQIGPDPLHGRFAARNFRSDIGLTGEVGSTLLALKAAMEARASGWRARNARRSAAVAAANEEARARRFAQARKDRDAPTLTKAWVSHALGEAVAGRGAAIFNELGCKLPAMRLDAHDAWFDAPHSGGLGWGFPAAMGYKLARPQTPVIAALGDGSYIFANPVACHQIAEARGLSIVLIVLNNAEWGAVRASVLGLYPDGHAARANAVPMTGLDPSPDFAAVARASRGWARRVQSADQFETALAEALAHTEANKGLALIEVSIARD
jgi:acetolactate synthase-1/2/3 large subunit